MLRVVCTDIHNWDNGFFKQVISFADQNTTIIRTSMEESFSERMWKSTEAERSRAMKSKFMSDIRVGRLDPVDFGTFYLHDTLVMPKIVDVLATAVSKTTDPDVKELLVNTQNIVESGVKERFTRWKLQLSDIKLDESKFAYATYLRNLTESTDTAYMIVAMIPYNRLWYWFGTQIDSSKCGIYQPWVEYNFNEKFRASAEVLENKVNDMVMNGKMDADKAMEVYKTCTKYEVDILTILNSDE